MTDRMLAWLGGVALLLLFPAQEDRPGPLRINEQPSSVYRNAGDFNHATQVVGDSLELLWIGRDRYSYPFYAQVDLPSREVRRVVKLSEKRGRGKGLRMNPSLGRYSGRTWAAWHEEIRKERRSHFLLNLLAVDSLPDPPAEEAGGSRREAAGERRLEPREALAGAEKADPRQIFDVGGLPSAPTFHETAHGFFLLGYGQDLDFKFRLRLFRLGSNGKWERVEQASRLRGLRPVLVEEGDRLWLYYLQTADRICRSFSEDGATWSEPETIGRGVAASVDAVVLAKNTAVAWTLGGKNEIEVVLSRCDRQGCSQPVGIFRAEGRRGLVALASEPASDRLFLLCSYWDSKNQSDVIEALAEARDFKRLRLTPEGEKISATRRPLIYDDEEGALAVWYQEGGQRDAKQPGGTVGLAVYDYGESRWRTPHLTVGAEGASVGIADTPRLAVHRDAVWLSYIACRPRPGIYGVPILAPTGDLYLKRVDLGSGREEGPSR